MVPPDNQNEALHSGEALGIVSMDKGSFEALRPFLSFPIKKPSGGRAFLIGRNGGLQVNLRVEPVGAWHAENKATVAGGGLPVLFIK